MSAHIYSLQGTTCPPHNNRNHRLVGGYATSALLVSLKYSTIMSENSEKRSKTLRCINLLDLRQSKHDFPPIVNALHFLARVTFQVDRLKLLVLGELGCETTEIGDLVIVHLSWNENEIRVPCPDGQNMP